MFQANRLLLISVLITLFYFFNPVISQDVNATITIPLNKTLTYKDKEIYSTFIELNSSSNVQIKFSNINSSLYFIVLQVHTQFEDIILYNDNVNKSIVKGRNVGLISMLKTTVSDILKPDTFFIENPNKNANILMYVAVYGYALDDPIPGGCNLEWSPPISPYLKTKTLASTITVEAEPASRDPNCELFNASNMVFYMMYQSEMNFNSDAYFDGIRNMMNLKNIETYGREIPRTRWLSRRMLSAYPGVSVVFVVVATNKTENGSFYSVYVPGHSYGCPEVNQEGCKFDGDFVYTLLCTVMLFVGLFVSFLGHRFFKTEMFLSGFFSGFIITYFLVITIETGLSTLALIAASVLSGIFFGAIWLLFWWLYGIPVIAVLLPTLNAGFICAAIVYYRLPATVTYLQNDLNFWTVFVMIMVLSATAMAFVTHSASILCCAFLGGFSAMFALDYYLSSTLKYIFVNTVRRAIVENFSVTIVEPPFMTREKIVTTLWITVSCLGWMFQLWHNRGRPPFPPPPRSTRPAVPGPTTYGAVVDYTRVAGGLYPQIRSPDRRSETPVLPRTTERTALLSATDG